MGPNPFLGVFFHWLGGLASASFYIPYRGVQKWAWETYWLAGGFFSWIIAPWVLALLLVPGVWDLIRQAPAKNVLWAYIFGAMWGLGGLTFGLTMRYLGIALGMAIALGYCAAFGTLMPPIFKGELGLIIHEPSGQVILLGVGVCLAGIAISGLAGMSKERELTDEQKKAAIREFSFVKGLLVATFSGVMSASFAYGLAAGKPIGDAAKVVLLAHGRADLWQNLPVLIVVLLGGFTTNFIWCVLLNWKNHTGHEYFAARQRIATNSVDADCPASTAAVPVTRGATAESDCPAPSGANDAAAKRPASRRTVAVATPRADQSTRVPLLSNWFFSAVAGTTWYMQFFFYSMGQTRMGKYDFSSWTLHMASIIIFSMLWGVALHEWKGTSRRTHALIAAGLIVLVGSTIIVGYGNYLKTTVT